jgi:hypothetical protein
MIVYIRELVVQLMASCSFVVVGDGIAVAMERDDVKWTRKKGSRMEAVQGWPLTRYASSKSEGERSAVRDQILAHPGPQARASAVCTGV